MSRIRYIKPGFFHDEDLADCQPFARLLFAGLWTIADREGRLEDRPRRIGAILFPYDNLDTDMLLDELHNLDLIVRYTVDGRRYISIPGWHKHQNPHYREAPSTLPSPPDVAPTLTQRCTNVEPTLNQGCVNVDPTLRQHPREERVTGNGNLKRTFTDSLPGIVGEVEDFTADGFDTFWTAYPNKQGKLPAQRRWKHMKAGERAEATIVAEAMTYAVEHGYRERALCPHGSTFLNQRRWEEWAEGAPPGYGPREGVPHDKTTEESVNICYLCHCEMSPDEVLEGHYHVGKGWRHQDCSKEEP